MDFALAASKVEKALRHSAPANVESWHSCAPGGLDCWPSPRVHGPES